MKIKINLDPINDGIIFSKSEGRNPEKAALIVGTDGSMRYVCVDELAVFLTTLYQNKGAAMMHLGFIEDYVLIYDRSKEFRNEDHFYFTGSAIVMRLDDSGRREDLIDDDKHNIRQLLRGIKEDLRYGEQAFSAFEVGKGVII